MDKIKTEGVLTEDFSENEYPTTPTTGNDTTDSNTTTDNDILADVEEQNSEKEKQDSEKEKQDSTNEKISEKISEPKNDGFVITEDYEKLIYDVVQKRIDEIIMQRINSDAPKKISTTEIDPFVRGLFKS